MPGANRPPSVVRFGHMSVVRLLALLLSAVLGGAPEARALSVQEAILRAKPAVALITTSVGAEVTMDCGQGPVTVTPAPFVETGTAWFIDGRGYLITNAHVVDPGAPDAPVGHPRAEEEGHRAGLRGAGPQGPAPHAGRAPRRGRAHSPPGLGPGSRQRQAQGGASTHGPALERRQARGGGEEVQRPHVLRQRRATHARLGARPRPAAREGRRRIRPSASPAAIRRSAIPSTSSASPASCSRTSC